MRLNNAALIAIFFCVGNAACHNASEQKTADDAYQAKIDGAVSCTSIGLYPADSVLYMQGGGAEYKTSTINIVKPKSTVEAMVWIPGGEFSMGGVNPSGMQDGGKEAMNDARPVHRVYVDGYLWMNMK